MAVNFQNNSYKNNEDNMNIWIVNIKKKTIKAFSYEEAIDIAVMSGCACEFQLDNNRKKILASTPLLGAIIMSYPWGYNSDTRGRRLSLLISMFGGFVTATLSALSPNWIVLAVLKLFSTSFSSCAQSVTYGLLGESCPDQVKYYYTFIMSSILNMAFPIYVSLGYISLKFDFVYDLGFITLTSWRVLTVTLALPMGISGLALLAFKESPKPQFLLNAGRDAEALEALRDIWRRTRRDEKKYPVEKLVSIQDGRVSKGPLYRSLWEQTAPLFRRPLLLRTLQLYFITGAIYSTFVCLLHLNK